MEYNKEWEYGTPVDCDCENNFIHVDCDCGCKSKEVCDCENILLEISKLKTQDIVLQREIDEISGSTSSGVTEEQMNAAIASAKTEIEAEIPTVPTSNTAFTNDAGYLTEHQHIKTINGLSLVGDGDIEIGTGGTIDLSNYYTTAQTDNLIESAVTRVEGEIPTVPTSNTAFTNDAGYATNGDVANVSTALTAHTSDTTVHVTAAEKSTWNNKASIWCGDETAWGQISGGTLDSNTIYLVY